MPSNYLRLGYKTIIIMKNVFFISMFLFGVVKSQVQAQDVQFGFKGGANFATITGDVSDDFSSITAIHFGVMTEIPISETFSFQPELLYSAQGIKDDEFDEKIKLNYLNIPLMGKYYVAEGFSLEAGPQIGFLSSAKSDVDGEEVDIKDSLKSIDFGLNLGLGYKMNNGLNFGARYNIGLSNINDEDGLGSVKNGVLQVSVGYFF